MNERPSTRAVVGGSLYVAAVVVIAAVAAWPVYASLSFFVLVCVATVVAAGIAVLSALRRWGGWLTTAALAGAFVVLAVPLAVPSRLAGPLEIVRGLGEAASGVLFAWKDLVTVDLPVGSYRNLLVPALVVFLVGTCVALRLSWRSDRWSSAAVAVGLAMTSFGLFFGRTSVSAPLTVGPLELHAPVETALGIAGLVTGLAWLAWRTHDERVRALRRAATTSGVRVSRRPSRTERLRGVTAVAMVAVALVAAVAVVPWAARGVERDVLRSAAGPEREIAAAVSPLTAYRSQFEGERGDEVLFRVEGDDPPERVRLATLDSYDGEIYRPGGGGAFVRVPSALDAGAGDPVDVAVTIDQLGGIWMPTAGRLAAVSFEGERATALADRFYYSSDAQAGVQTAEDGLVPGDAYRLQAIEQPAAALAEIAPASAGPDGAEAPENLRRWVEGHVAGSGGVALEGLVSLLRERGFLSHALTETTPVPSWMTDLPDYTFQPSASGHSLARIDALFARLLERESDPRAEQAGNFVAAIGDDEQFAVATALIAQELGFPARVVVGTRLFSADPDLATCDDGVCLARDLSAWTEVLSSEGQWVPVDVTPQWTQSPSLDVTEQRDPENVTEVRPDSVEEVVPPAPLQEDNARDEPDDDESGVDLAWLWSLLRTVGLVLLALLIVLGPFLVVVGAKAVRRRGRRSTGEPAERIAGGWEEYVDAGVDTGRAAPRTLTRREVADAYATRAGLLLADEADRAVFSPAGSTDEEAAEFWRIVDAERRAMRRERGPWRSILSAVSLKSFARLLAPRTAGRAARLIERGRRRTPGRGRTTS